MTENNMTNEEIKTESTPSNTSEGNQPSTPSMLDKIDTSIKRMEEVNKKAEDLLRQNTELYSRMRMHGSASAGSVNKTPEQIQKDNDEAEIKATVQKFYK